MKQAAWDRGPARDGRASAVRNRLLDWTGREMCPRRWGSAGAAFFWGRGEWGALSSSPRLTPSASQRVSRRRSSCPPLAFRHSSVDRGAWVRECGDIASNPVTWRERWGLPFFPFFWKANRKDQRVGCHIPPPEGSVGLQALGRQRLALPSQWRTARRGNSSGVCQTPSSINIIKTTGKRVLHVLTDKWASRVSMSIVWARACR